MNIKNRLEKLENAAGVNSEYCSCPDSLIFVATEYGEKCYRCEKPVNLYSWKSWNMIYPTVEDMGFAFGMERADVGELGIGK